jgi:2-polyprenyl-3-methyl-5-hydroxy-6-metoxy-1,4-benzoquinol methylase
MPVITRRVREQYETYPFPAVTRIHEEDPERGLRDSYNLDHALVGRRALAPGARVWVAGASTRWALLAALQMRDVQVVGSDLSESSLALQERLARALSVENLELRHEDLVTAGYQSEFDLVICSGVLHHLESQAAGLAALARALKPGGLVELMVYDPINRRDAVRVQAMLRVLLPEGSSAAERLATARELLTHLSPTLLAKGHPLRRLGRAVADADMAELSDLADLVSHPHEMSYDVHTLKAALAAGRLRLRQWKNPKLFTPAWMLDDPEIVKQIAALGPEAEHVCQLIANPLLELFAEKTLAASTRASTPRASPIEERRVRDVSTRVVHHVDPSGRVTRSMRRSRVARTRGGVLRVAGIDRQPCVTAYALDTLLPPIAAELLARARQPVKVGELVRELARTHRLSRKERHRLVALCDAMCRPPARVLAVTA